jgi:hypothetical protein
VDSVKRLLACIVVSVTALAPTVACGASDSAEPAAHVHPTTGASPQPLRPGERFVPLSVSDEYTPDPPGGAADDYRCMIIDPRVTEPVFLTGVQFQPEDPSIVHHALTFAVPSEQVSAVRALDARTPGEGYTCFGAMSAGSVVDTWTPGGVETLFDGDMGYPLRPGAVLVVQIHYNLLAVRDGDTVTDRSGVRLRQTDGTPDTLPLETVQLAAPVELPCAPGESGPLCDRSAAMADVADRFGPAGRQADWLLSRCGHDAPRPGSTQTCDSPAPAAVTVRAARPHMHLLGRSIKVELNPGTAEARVLLDVADYNYDNQALRILPEPVALQAGDTLRTTCTHDAGLRRQLPQLRDLPPRYVVWGEGTADEMCAPGLIVTPTT